MNMSGPEGAGWTVDERGKNQLEWGSWSLNEDGRGKMLAEALPDMSLYLHIPLRWHDTVVNRM